MVFLTGGAFTPKARAFFDANGYRCIEKPFDANALRQTVRDLVRQKAA
jgi:DNA-binding NtrC family response regulator